jgi:SAM-dependent methyltransferase
LSDPLKFTGERFTPECVREIRYEHVHRYVFARELVTGLTVLDAACGEGYGSAILAETAAEVSGVDLSGEAIAHAKARYHSSNLRFSEADCTSLPFGDDAFDCVISFETLEHLEQQEELLAEFRRVLRPGGFLLISTPDKAVYTDKLGNQNEFHVSELYRDEFEALLARHFPAFCLWGQKLVFQSCIWAQDDGEGVSFHQEGGVGISSASRPEHEAVYLLALCALSEESLPEVNTALSLFDDAAESVHEHYHHEIRKNMEAGGILAEKDREIAELKETLKRVRHGSSGWWSRLFGKD